MPKKRKAVQAANPAVLTLGLPAGILGHKPAKSSSESIAIAKVQRKARQKTPPQQSDDAGSLGPMTAERRDEGQTVAGRKASGKRSGDSDIDELFTKLKQQRQRRQSQPAPEAVAATSAVKVVGDKDDIFGNGPQKQRRYDEEGLAIYTPEELNVGKGGDTADCPFDCQCCF